MNRNQKLALASVAALLAVVAVLLARRPQETSPEAPSAPARPEVAQAAPPATSDDHRGRAPAQAVPPPRVGGGLFSDTPLGEAAFEAFSFLEVSAPDAEARAARLIGRLQAEPEASFREIESAYERLPREDFNSRNKLLFLAGQLRSPASTPWLSAIASEQVPANLPPYRGDGTEDLKGKEIMLRMWAIGALKQVAGAGDSRARDTLFKLAGTTDVPNLKDDAVWAFLATSTDPEGDRARLKAALPAKDHGLLDQKPSDLGAAQAAAHAD